MLICLDVDSTFDLASIEQSEMTEKAGHSFERGGEEHQTVAPIGENRTLRNKYLLQMLILLESSQRSHFNLFLSSRISA
jgi:hypothetical protein